MSQFINSEPRGYFRVWRGWRDSASLGGLPYDRRSAWLWLVETACWKPTKFNLNGKTVTLERGQLVVSTRQLGRAWGWSESAVRRFLTRLKTDAAIDAATDAGRTLITLCNYATYQDAANETDAPSDAATDARATHKRIKEEVIYDDTQPDLPDIPSPSSLSRKSQNANREIDERFEAFWKLYPRKRDKGHAMKAYRRAVTKNRATHDEIMAGLNGAIAHWRHEGREPDFIPYGATWLNGDGWLDEYGGTVNGSARTDEEWRAMNERWAREAAALREAGEIE